jgi:hypothetical protein
LRYLVLEIADADCLVHIWSLPSAVYEP